MRLEFIKELILRRINQRQREFQQILTRLSDKKLIFFVSLGILLIFSVQYFKVRQFHSNPYLITSGIFKFTIYTSLSIYGSMSLLEDIFTVTENSLSIKNDSWVLNTPCWVEQVPLNTKTRVHYILQISVYLVQLLLLQFDTKNRDFIVMFIHHIITLILLIYSYKFRLIRIGQVIMVLHDINDPLLQIAKLCLRFKQTRKANMVFSLFSITFFFTRLLFFPMFCILPLFYYIRFESIENTTFFFILKILLSCLVVLYILNLVWFGFVVSLLFRIWSKKEIKDITKPSFTSKSKLKRGD